MEKSLLNKRFLSLIFFLFIIALSGASYAWLTYAAGATGLKAKTGMGVIKINAMLVSACSSNGEAVEEFVKGDLEVEEPNANSPSVSESENDSDSSDQIGEQVEPDESVEPNDETLLENQEDSSSSNQPLETESSEATELSSQDPSSDADDRLEISESFDKTARSLAVGESISFSYLIENPEVITNDNTGEILLANTVPAIFEVNLEGVVYITSDESGNPLHNDFLSKDALESVNLQDLIENGVISVEYKSGYYDSDEAFSSRFDNNGGLQSVWLKNKNSNSENADKLYCFLVPSNTVQMTVTFKFNNIGDELLKYQGAIIDHRLSFYAVQPSFVAIRNNFAIENLDDLAVIGEVVEETIIYYKKADIFDSNLGPLGLKNQFAVSHKTFDPKPLIKANLLKKDNEKILEEMGIDESSSWNPVKPGNEVYRRLLTYFN